MSPSRRRSLLLIPLALAAASVGCTVHVETPRITARDLRFVGMDNNGLSFDVNFSAYNANTFELDIRELNATLWLEGNHVGAGVSNVVARLPPMRETPVTGRVTIPWHGAPAYLMAAAGSPVVNYQIRGDVRVHHYLSIRAPFESAGTVPRDFFLRGAQNAVNGVLNSLLPGMGVQVQ